MFVIYPLMAGWGIRNGWPWLRRIVWRQLVLLTGLALLWTAWFFNGVSLVGQPYPYALLPEYTLLGLVSPFHYFNMAIASMIQEYGIASVGLDGLPVIPYHVGSYYWIAAMGRMGESVPLYVFPFAYYSVVLPGLITSAAMSAAMLLPRHKPLTAAFLAVMFLLQAGVEVIGSTQFHYSSESFIFSILLFCLVLPLLHQGFRTLNSLSWTYWMTGLLLSFLLLAFKLSTGLIWGAAWGWMLLRRQASWAWKGKVILILFMVILGGLYLFAARPEGYIASSGIVADKNFLFPFFFFRYYNKFPLHAIAVLLLPMAYLIIMAFHYPKAINGSSTEYSSYWKCNAEMAGILLLAAHLPTVLGLLGGVEDEGYFIYTGHWAILPLVLAHPWWNPVAEKKRKIATIASLVLLAIFMVPWNHLQGQLRNRMTTFIQKIQPLIWQADGAVLGQLLQGRSVGQYIYDSLRQHYRLFGPDFIIALEAGANSRLIRLAKQEFSQTKTVGAIYVPPPRPQRPPNGVASLANQPYPPENARLWQEKYYFVKSCTSQQMRIPALTGLPLLLGIPPENSDCPRVMDFGIRYYGSASTYRPLSDPALCLQAKARGIQHILVVKNLDRDEDWLPLDCAKISPLDSDSSMRP
ncbi:MAG: hypothetical protein G8345_17910 [Magnetococcales bacterium]|nr:hypothetical protein [Magnetococcales bacterium]